MSTPIEPTIPAPVEAPCSAFAWRLNTTDGSEPIDIFRDEDGSMVYQGADVLGAGGTMLEAWNDYLFSLPLSGAPVGEADLASMWAAYDKSNAQPNERA